MFKKLAKTLFLMTAVAFMSNFAEAQTPKAASVKKFLNAFLDDTRQYVEPEQVRVWSGYEPPPMFKILAPENLNKLFNQFVQKNYKK